MSRQRATIVQQASHHRATAAAGCSGCRGCRQQSADREAASRRASQCHRAAGCARSCCCACACKAAASCSEQLACITGASSCRRQVCTAPSTAILVSSVLGAELRTRGAAACVWLLCCTPQKNTWLPAAATASCTNRPTSAEIQQKPFSHCASAGRSCSAISPWRPQTAHEPQPAKEVTM